MKATIITIGDELLLGQTINTNLAKIGKSLSEIGISVVQSSTVLDEQEAIVNILNSFLKISDIIIITGGLGPTKDDLTKITLANYFNSPLEMNTEVLENVTKIFKDKGRIMLPANREQALVPKNCTLLFNYLGTAPGMWFEKDNKIIVSLPGVPYELEALIEKQVAPRLAERFKLKKLYYQTLMIQGIGESFLAEKIKHWEDRVRGEGFHLAYLPTPGLIRLRLSTDDEEKNKNKIETYLTQLENDLPEYIYARNDESIFYTVGEILKEKNATLGTVESCTGGGIGSSFVAFPGASTFFKGGLITYSNELKEKLAGVSPETLKKYGAVSKEVAIEMAKGGMNTLNVDYIIAVTGIAGPDGGTESKPVGTVWIAIGTPNGITTKLFRFGNNRTRNLQQTQLYAANFLRKILLNIKSI